MVGDGGVQWWVMGVQWWVMEGCSGDGGVVCSVDDGCSGG